VLIPCAADKLRIPMIASGGFGDGRGLVAALALGADGINMGTRFLATREAPVHDNVKQALVSADERQTALIFRSLKNTARIFKNSVAERVVDIENRGGATIEDLAPYVAGAKGRVLLERGDMEHGIWSAGMVTGLIQDVPSVAELVHRIVSEARAIIAGRLAAVLDEARP
jgi:nitronate monooxygenase